MGNFYVSMAVATEDRDAVIGVLNHVPDKGVVAPAGKGWVVFSTEHLETQDEERVDLYGTRMSRGGAPVLAVMNHDDDILFVMLYRDGRRVARAVTDPGSLQGLDLPPELDGLAEIAALAEGASEDRVRQVLTSDNPFAVEIHGALAELLGLPKASVGFGHRYFDRGEYGPEGYTRTGKDR